MLAPKPSSFGSFALPILLPLLSAMLLAASFPNPLFKDGIFPLGFLALAPLMASLARRRRRAAPAMDAVSGLVFGLAAYALTCPWVFGYHPAAPLALLAAKGISCAIAALLSGRLLRSYPRRGWLAAAALWTAGEYLGASGFLAFPYGIIGYSQAMNLPLLATAALWGVHGVSFILAAVSSYLASILSEIPMPAADADTRVATRIRAFQGFALACLVLAAHLAGGLSRLARDHDASRASGEELSIIVFQADTAPRKEGPKPPVFYAELIKELLASANDELPRADIVVTPETVYPYSLEIGLALDEGTDESIAAKDIVSALADSGIPCLFGNARLSLPDNPRAAAPLLRNSALYLEDGKVWASYDKQRLVPFIETFPFSRAFPRLHGFLEDMNGMFWTAGESPGIFRVGTASLGVLICYEDCFGSDARRLSRLNANLLLSMASDAWAGSESAMRQHLHMAAFRAAETGIPLLRATNDGVTCLVDGSGKISEEMAPFERGTRRYEVRTGGVSRTPYTALGDVFPLLAGLASCAALAASALAAVSAHPRRVGASPPCRRIPDAEGLFIDKTGFVVENGASFRILEATRDLRMDSRKKILIVDDEVINLEFFDVMLSKLGFIVEKAENGEEALEVVREFLPDLVILDNIMPKLSGWEVTKTLKTDPAWAEFSEIPIIMFSALDDVKDKVEGFELGVEDYITKPYNFSEVLVRIRALLRTRELIAQLEQRETRIELTEKLNDGLVSFAESLRAPLESLLRESSSVKDAKSDPAAFAKAFEAQAKSVLSRLDELAETISSLKEEEARIRENEIGIKALRGSLIRKS